LVEKLGLPLSSSAAPGRYTSLLVPRERSSSYSQAEEAKEAKEAKETEDEDEILVCFASTRSKHPQRGDAMPETYGYALPTIRGYYSGVGDLFSALVLGHYKDQRSLDAAKEEKEGGSGRTLERAVSLALLGVQIVLLKTHLSTLPLNDNNNDNNDNGNNVGDLDCIPSDDELDKEDNKEDNKENNREEADDVEPLRRPARRARRMRLRELRVVQERRALMDLADDENEDGDGGWKGKRLDWDALLREEEVSR
jgi:pyridoxine kinase